MPNSPMPMILGDTMLERYLNLDISSTGGNENKEGPVSYKGTATYDFSLDGDPGNPVQISLTGDAVQGKPDRMFKVQGFDNDVLITDATLVTYVEGSFRGTAIRIGVDFASLGYFRYTFERIKNEP